VYKLHIAIDSAIGIRILFCVTRDVKMNLKTCMHGCIFNPVNLYVILICNLYLCSPMLK
jgi:hypothetical protein